MSYCRNCGHELKDGDKFCTQCGTPTVAEQQETPHREQQPPVCANCHQPMEPGALFCPNCGYAPMQDQQAGGTAYTEDMQKSKLAAGLLGIFLGSLGIHNFYLGNTSRAVIQLLLGTVGAVCCGLGTIASGVWGLIEGIMILSGSIKTDGNNVPLKD